ncbi:P-loop containing nucleoside triphosphate hydrolase protein [Biscogniauxia mediterranea]|nr:P-loop containing nucleoside triphosphate hydrolase protein [Biscogniauxia mediterranea]
MPRPCTTCRGQARAADNHVRAEGRVMEDVNMEDIDIDAPADPVSLLCEIKHLEQRHVDGQAILLDLDAGQNQNHLSRDWWFSHYALCTIRSYSDTGRLVDHALYVNSQSLRDFLQAVIGDLEADGSGGMEIIVKAPFFPLFYNLERLTSHSKRFAPFVYSRPETELLLSWIRGHFRREIELVESNAANPETTTIPFESLWAAFPPRSIVCPLVVHISQAARVVECWYVSGGACPSLVLKAEYVDWDGESMGLRDFEIAIESYAGAKRLVDLSVRPVKSMKNPSTVRNYLLDCGRKFESYTGMRLKQYDGIAIAHDKRVHISGHIMLDDKSYCRSRNITPAPMRKITRVPKQVSARPELTTNTANQLSEDDAMITALTMRGIYLNDDLPAQFVVASISDVQWNEQCLDELVMNSETKQTLQAHMARQDKANDGDSAAAEGPREKQDQGFVCILSGPSGVGKTTTAVTLSASAQRPVYRISGRRLDTFSLDGEVYLSEAMSRAAEWGAALLIEEADHLLGNQALREVLLRALDRQHASIVFLTTTTTTRTLEPEDWRLGAPHQEVRLRLSYPDEAAQLQLWQKALRARSRHVGGAPELDWLRGLARDYPFNGWQIEFAVGRACEAVAGADGYPRFAHLDEGARAAANPGAAGGGGPGWGAEGRGPTGPLRGPEEASARLFRSRP